MSSTPETGDQSLTSGTVVDEYIIERVLAKGGFSTVYLARQIGDQQQVAIKEYMPDGLTSRCGLELMPSSTEQTRTFQHGRRLFLEEAKLLSGLKHPNIVHVLNFFIANNTAYLVMNFDYGTTLANWLKKTTHVADTQFLLDVFQPVMRCIKNMHHRGLLHLDIKPDNILLRPSNNPLILDFGSALPYKKQQQCNSHSLTKGYAAPEQHHKQHPLGPWSDIYAIGASMRNCLDKIIPPPSTDQALITERSTAYAQFKNKVDVKVLHAIDWATQTEPAKRPQTIEELLNAIRYL